MKILMEYLNVLNKCTFITNSFRRKKTRIKTFIFVESKLEKNKTNRIFVNNKSIDFYFNKNEVNSIIGRLMLSNLHKKYILTILLFVKGGGIINQKEVIGNALEDVITHKFENTLINPNFYKRVLKQKDYRKKERKKFGLKKARKASQYHKR